MNYWLIKSEPDDFGIDDLARQGQEPWTGVRNYQARNHMRDLMQVGDQVLFYHSNVPRPGIVGLAEVLTKPYADPTQFNLESEYFDPKSILENPRWQLVDMGFVEKFPHEISLEELKNDPFFADMLVAKRGQRLSVQPVAKKHFTEVLRRCRT